MATQYPNGHRFKSYYKYESKKHQPYDFRNKGLLNKIMSNKIYNTKNKLLQAFLIEYEKIIYLWINYADILWNFKNPRFRNR